MCTLILSNWEKRKRDKQTGKNQHKKKRRCAKKKRIFLDNKAISDGCVQCTGVPNTKQDFCSFYCLLKLICYAMHGCRALKGSPKSVHSFDENKTAWNPLSMCEFVSWLLKKKVKFHFTFSTRKPKSECWKATGHLATSQEMWSHSMNAINNHGTIIHLHIDKMSRVPTNK